MSHHRRSEARRRRAIERRQKAEAEARKLREERIRAGLEALMAPADAYAFQPWGYLMPERDGIDTPTGYLPVIDFVLTHPFPIRGSREVTP